MNADCNVYDRQNNFDLLRIIATFAVILIHVNVYISGQKNISLIDYNTQSFINVITRFSVPCFVMMSGAFILSNRDNSEYKRFYAKSFYKIGIPLIIFSIVTIGLSMISSIMSNENIFIPILYLLKGDFSNYWFMFMLIGLYFLAPIIIRIKDTISNKEYCIGSVIWMIIACVSQSTSTYKVSYSFGVVFSFLGYFLVGNVIYENFRNIKFSFSFIFLLLSVGLFFLIYILRAYTSYSMYIADQYTNWFSPLIVFASIFLFIGFANLKIRINLAKLSSTTYIIYLFHTKVYLVIIYILSNLFPIITEYITVYILIVSILAFSVSMILSLVYLKIWNLLENKFLWKKKWRSKIDE